MSKFKTGDKVILVEDTSFTEIKKGQIWEVVEDSTDVNVTIRNDKIKPLNNDLTQIGWGVYPHRLKLANSAKIRERLGIK